VNESSIPLYAGGPPQSDQIFLQNLGASQEYVDQMRWEKAGGDSLTTWLDRTLSQSSVGSDQDSPLIPAEEARARLKHESVTFDIPDSGIREATYQSMLKRQYDKRAAEDAIQRGPHGFLAGARGLGIELARQAIDPINLAAAFVPVVGEVRMAEMLAAAGTSWAARAGVFAKVGAIEGTVGTAMLEPAMHYMAGQLQEDYTMADSLLNIAFGGVIGGGLHVGVGSIKEWYVGRGVALAPGEAPNHLIVPAQGEIPERIAALDRGTRIEIGKAALAQAIDGREIDIAPMLDLAGIEASVNAQERKPGFLKSAEELFAQRQEERLRGTPGFLQSGLDKLAIKDLDEAIAAEDARIQERISGEIQNQLGKIEDARQRELQQRIATQEPDTTATQLADLMERQQARKELLESPARLVEEAKARDLTVNEIKDKLNRMQAAGERDIKTYKEAALRQISSVSPDIIHRLNEARKTAAERTQSLAKAAQSPESGIPRESLQLSAEAERIVKEESTPVDQPDSATARTALQDAEAELKRLVADEASLHEAFPVEDAAIKQAKDDKNILTALAQCHLRRG
jgi:hypothetical protein